jgi:hypothetical protein
MSNKVKAFVYNFLSFALFFLPSYYLIQQYGGLTVTGYLIPITAFVIATLLAPKFQAVQTRDGEKIFMKWILMKEVKELK